MVIGALAVVTFGFSSVMLSYACGRSVETVRKESPPVDACAPIRSYDFEVHTSWEWKGEPDGGVTWTYSKQDENYYGYASAPGVGTDEILSIEGKYPY